LFIFVIFFVFAHLRKYEKKKHHFDEKPVVCSIAITCEWDEFAVILNGEGKIYLRRF